MSHFLVFVNLLTNSCVSWLSFESLLEDEDEDDEDEEEVVTSSFIVSPSA